MNDEFPFAPRRQRPLSLLNPFDYLLLLYRVFYFPQALRWYVERFGTSPAEAPIREVLRQDKGQRGLVAQALVLLGLLALAAWLLLPELGLAVNLTKMALGVVGVRLDADLLCLVPAWLQRSKEFAIRLQRVSPLPVPGLETSLTERLRSDWLAGLRVCEGLLCYTLQFMPVVGAIRANLEAIEGARLLPRIAAWCDLGLNDWRALRYQSASLRSGLATAFREGFWAVSYTHLDVYKRQPVHWPTTR